MPRLIAPVTEAAIAPEELVDRLAGTHWNVRDEESVAAIGPWLGRVARDPAFLADRAVAELEGMPVATAVAADGLTLAASERYVLRATCWPAGAAAGYGEARNHTAPALVAGCLGPGHRTDDYLFDGVAHGIVGEPAGLEPAGQTRLAPGVVALYRAHRDVAMARPPAAFSVSLGLHFTPPDPWRTAYRFDLAGNAIAAVLTVTAAEALVTLAVHFGGEEAVGLVHDLAARHPATRMRTAALAALGSVAHDDEARAWIYALAADDPDVTVAAHARARLREIAP